MRHTTLKRLRCPKLRPRACACPLTLKDAKELSYAPNEIQSGTLYCPSCHSKYPILGGVAVVLDDVDAYVYAHAQGIARHLRSEEVPRYCRTAFVDGRRESDSASNGDQEHLEAERVISLYALNHYLSSNDLNLLGSLWWGAPGAIDPVIANLVRTHWDQGPHAIVRKWLEEGPRGQSQGAVLELGCSVGGMLQVLASSGPNLFSEYLGIDSSFASVVAGRAFCLGLSPDGDPAQMELKYPQDLLNGPFSQKIRRPRQATSDSPADLIVGDALNLPLEPSSFNTVIALNLIDMLDEPERLPPIQAQMLMPRGRSIQGSPYIWSDQAAKRLRKLNATQGKKPSGSVPLDSASVVEAIYQLSGFKIVKTQKHIPWLFYKHSRQMEIYSVHLFEARKSQ